MFIKDQSDFLIRTRIWGLFSPQNTHELPVTRLKVFVHSTSNGISNPDFEVLVGDGKKPLRQLTAVGPKTRVKPKLYPHMTLTPGPEPK